MKKLKKAIGILIMSLMVSTAFAKNPFKMQDADYAKMVETSLISVGNNYRLKNAIEKIKKGEKVWIAALGGSVTEGAGPAKFTDGYAYQFFRDLKKTYAPGDGKNVNFNNAGLSGTPSLLGLVRYQSDVVEVCGQNPDILIVEFAVNDGGEATFQKSFEGIVRDALKASPNTAVIALYAAATYGNTAAQKKPISDLYQIPQINMLGIVKDGIAKGHFSEKEYYTDNVHPTIQGHTLMSDCLMNLVATVDKAKIDEKIEVPTKSFARMGLSGLKRIYDDDKNVKISKGSFTDVDKQCQSVKKTNASNFPKNWNKKMNLKATNEPFKMDIKCKSLVFVYKVQGSWMSDKFGKAKIFVDGKEVATYDGGKAGGWNNCEAVLLINQNESKNHTVEVKMAEGSEKLGFTIVAMGYVE